MVICCCRRRGCKRRYQTLGLKVLSWCFNLLLQDSVWLICCWVCVCASGFVVFGFQL